MRRIFAFIRHRLTSNTRHGTHSPFVYNLVEKCIYAKDEGGTGRVRQHFSRLRHSRERVRGMDYGSPGGAEVDIAVSRLVQTSAARDFESGLLARLVRYHRPETVLELGANTGKSTAFMADSCAESRVVAVEGNAGMAAFAQRQLDALGLTNASVVCARFDHFLDADAQRFNMVFIDGDHHYETTLRYYQKTKARLEGEGPVVLHDIYWSAAMNRAWQEIVADAEATVTIDLFFFGLVYFRKGQRKQHFSICFPRSLFLLIR